MNKTPVFIVDAFVSEALRGNPAAVCFVDKSFTDKLLQSIAAELKLSETAFVIPDESGGFSIRWFTPSTEMPLCGHATLAAAAVIFEKGLSADKTLSFSSISGTLTAYRDGGKIFMRFPADDYEDAQPEPELLTALGVHKYLRAIAGKNTRKLVIHLPDERTVENLRPDFAALLALNKSGKWKGVGVTGESASPSYDCVSRYFNPWAGVDEDPVTGSVHTILAPYWSRLKAKTRLVARQASPRGGKLFLEIISADALSIGGEYRFENYGGADGAQLD
jgi:PhzF family phenazine biosynthesis protein